MILLVHILTALTSVAYTTYLFFWPSPAKFKVSYALVAATVASGTYLVWSTHAQLLQSCLTGVLYIGVVSLGMGLAYRRLAAQKIDR